MTPHPRWERKGKGKGVGEMTPPHRATSVATAETSRVPRRVDRIEMGSSRTHVSVVIPTLNEAENLPHVLPKLSSFYEVIIVDGNSTDGSIDVARRLLPHANIVRQTRHGKGEALACGFAAASGDIIVMLDADGSARPEEIPRFVKALERGADFAKGSRYLHGGGSADLTVLRSAGNRLLSLLVNILFRTRYTDLCYGYNAFWRRHLPTIALDSDGFEVETLISLRACKADLVVVEVASYEEARIHGISKLNTFRDGYRILCTILRERFTRPRPKEARRPVSAEAS
jgi:glycosyltransferase involved in cell wall biosynthesis